MSDKLISIVFSAAFLWLLLATVYRLVVWARTPSPLPIPLTPAPTSRLGVLVRLLLELFAFRSLARASTVTWVASVLFHYGLLVVLLMHIRFLTPQFPVALVPIIRISGWAAVAMLVGLGALLVRRCVVDRVRYISSPSDYLHLVLLMSIAASGMALKRLWPVDLFAVGEFLRGTLTLQWKALPDGSGLLIHLLLVLVLLLIFPISKLVHGLGILFSPTLNQRDTSRITNRESAQEPLQRVKPSGKAQ